MSYRVPFVDPRTHYRRLKSEIDDAIVGCLSQGDLIYRQQLRSFEENLARFVGTKYAVGVNSGYHALYYALVASGVGPGDEVITVAHTFVATVSAIVHSGAKPILIDIGKDYNMNCRQIAGAITPATKAILPVHLNGRLSDMQEVMQLAKRHDLVVIEDAAQALGASQNGTKAGAIGHVGCFSFYPFKVLGGFGDGGALTTNDERVATMVRRLRYNGEDRETGEYHYHGHTALLDNVQAAVLDVKLRHLPKWLDHRKFVAKQYRSALEGVDEISLPHFPAPSFDDVYQNYVIRTLYRDQLRTHLKTEGIETLVHWPKPMWRHEGLKLGDVHLPETESVCREVLSLPMSAETTEDQITTVTDAIKSFFSQLRTRIAVGV